MKKLSAAMLLVAMMLNAHAAGDDVDDTAASADAVEASSHEWTGSLGGGALFASGNTESESVNIDATAELSHGLWRHSFRVTGYEASEQGEQTAERYTASAQTNYSLSERSYLFLRGSYEADAFGAFDRRASVTTGPGRRFVDTETVTLDLEAGIGHRVSEPDGTNDRDGEGIARFGGQLDWAFGENSAFTQELEIESGSSNTSTESISSIRSRLIGDLSWRLSHTIVHNSDVAAGADKTDTYTAVAVEYAF